MLSMRRSWAPTVNLRQHAGLMHGAFQSAALAAACLCLCCRSTCISALNLGMASLTACPFCFAGPHSAQRRSCRQPQMCHCICMQGTAGEVAVMTQELSRLADEMLPKGETAGDDSGELGSLSLSQRLKASWDNKVGFVTLIGWL